MLEMDLQGPVAPPMANGEVIFEAPWQSRVFGMARVLCEAGHYSWDEFRHQLIKQIEDWESHHNERHEVEYPYFDCFLNALTDILEAKGLCSTVDMSVRADEFSARPHGHDH